MQRYKFTTLFIAGLRAPHLFARYIMGKDPSEIELGIVARYVKTSNPVIVEAGAFNGADTVIFANNWKSGFVYAFEPMPALYQQVLNRTHSYPNVKVFDKALVGDSRNFVELHTFQEESDQHGSSSILEPSLHVKVSPTVKFGKSVSVPCTTLDKWAEENKIDRIDLLWLDLQGAELEALSEGLKVIRMTQVCHIEVSRKALYSGAAVFKDVHRFMTLNGFKLVLKRIPVISGNALYVKNANA